MDGIKISQVYKLIIPGKFNKNDVINELSSILKRKINISTEFLDAMTLYAQDDKTFDVLNIKFKTKYLFSFMVISMTINGKEIDNKEYYEKEPILMDILLEYFNGLLWIDYYKYVHSSEKTCTKYIINYKEDSDDYNIIQYLLEKMDNPEDIIYNKELLKEYLKDNSLNE